MCIYTVYARHPAEMFHISLFNASVLIHIVYNSKKMPNLGPLYGIELGIWSEVNTWRPYRPM